MSWGDEVWRGDFLRRDRHFSFNEYQRTSDENYLKMLNTLHKRRGLLHSVFIQVVKICKYKSKQRYISHVKTGEEKKKKRSKTLPH